MKHLGTTEHSNILASPPPPTKCEKPKKRNCTHNQKFDTWLGWWGLVGLGCGWGSREVGMMRVGV